MIIINTSILDMTAYKNRQTGCKSFEGSDAAMDS